MREPLAIAALGVALLSLALPAEALAQDPVTPNAAQTQLNEEAVEATRAGDFDKAAQLFEASLQLGELNITWLNLGRTLFKLERCEEADAAYARALQSPTVASPSPAAIAQTVSRYRGELQQSCPGQVAISCDPAEMTIAVDGEAPRPCPSEPISLSAGEHEIVGEAGTRRTSLTITVTAMKTAAVTLELPGGTRVGPPESPPPPEPGLSAAALGGWISLGLGGALISGGLAYDVFSIQPGVDELGDLAAGDDRSAWEDKKGELETAQAVNLGVFASGGGLIALGGVLLLLDSGDDAPEPSAFEIRVGPQEGGVTWSTRW